jgi:hypothetical protein
MLGRTQERGNADVRSSRVLTNENIGNQKGSECKEDDHHYVEAGSA